MEMNALEWFSAYTSGKVDEAYGLGLANKTKKIHKEKDVGQVAANIGFAHLADMTNKEIRDYFLEYAKNVASTSKTMRVGRSQDTWTSQANLMLNFKEFTDAMNVKTRPRLYVSIRSDNRTKVEIDFRRDTAGSGAFNSRKVPVIEGQIEDIAEDLLVCIQNIKKLDNLESADYPSDWNKKEYKELVNGITSLSYNPKKQSSHAFTAKDIETFLDNPKFYYGERFNYIQVLETMLNKTILIQADVFKNYDDTSADWGNSNWRKNIKNVRKYKKEVQGKPVNIWIVMDMKFEFELSIRDVCGREFYSQTLFDSDSSMYSALHRVSVEKLEDYPEIAQSVCRIDTGSELYQELKKKIIHYFSANKNTLTVKKAKERILAMNAEHSK